MVFGSSFGSSFLASSFFTSSFLTSSFFCSSALTSFVASAAFFSSAGGFSPTIVASFGTSTSNRIAASLFTHFIVAGWIGRCWESYGMRVMPVSIAAIFALSQSGVLVRLTGSTRTNWRPCAVSNAYQKRSLPSAQCGETLVSKTSLPTFEAIHLAARS